MSFHSTLYCPACGNRHNNLTIEDKEAILNAFVFGDAQIITKSGIKYHCILDLTEYDNVAIHRAGTKAHERLSNLSKESDLLSYLHGSNAALSG